MGNPQSVTYVAGHFCYLSPRLLMRGAGLRSGKIKPSGTYRLQLSELRVEEFRMQRGWGLSGLDVHAMPRWPSEQVVFGISRDGG